MGAGVTVGAGHPSAAPCSLGSIWALLGRDASLLWVSFLGWVPSIQAVPMARGERAARSKPLYLPGSSCSALGTRSRGLHGFFQAPEDELRGFLSGLLPSCGGFVRGETPASWTAAGAVPAAAVPQAPAVSPLPRAGSGIGLGYYSNAAFLLN